MNKHRILALYTYMVLIILLLTHISFLVSAELYEYSDTGNQEQGVYGSSNRYGQTFTIGTIGDNEEFWFTNYSLYIKKAGTPNRYTSRIYATDVNGKPTGSPIGYCNLSAASFSTSYSWKTFVLDNQIHLYTSTKYAIVINNSASSSSNAYRFYYDNNVYAGGNYIQSSDSGSTWNPAAYDMRFRIYGDKFGITLWNLSYTNVNPANNSFLNFTYDYDILKDVFDTNYFLNLSFNKTSLQGYNTTTETYFNYTLVDTHTWINGSRTVNLIGNYNKKLYDGVNYTWSINTSYYNRTQNNTYHSTFNILFINLPVGNCSNTSLTVYNNTVNTTGNYETSYNSSTGNKIWLNFTGIGGGNITGYTEEEVTIYTSSGMIFASIIGLMIFRRKKK